MVATSPSRKCEHSVKKKGKVKCRTCYKCTHRKNLTTHFGKFALTPQALGVSIKIKRRKGAHAMYDWKVSL